MKIPRLDGVNVNPKLKVETKGQNIKQVTTTFGNIFLKTIPNFPSRRKHQFTRGG